MCVESWIEKFIKDSEKEKNYDVCLHYEQLSTVFSPFLMLFYTLLQWLTIITSFASIFKLVNQDSTESTEYFFFFGYALVIGEEILFLFSSSISYLISLSGSYTINLMALTFTIESAFHCVQNVLRRTEERLLMTRDKSERQKLKYEIRKLSKLEPMTGGGYFEISKSTLTSMLSVR